MFSADDGSRTSFRNVVYLFLLATLSAIVCLCLIILEFLPPSVFLSVSSCVTNSNLGFSLTSRVPGYMWVCVCLGLYAILVFPRF
jgi:hypothetical protein